MTFCFLRVGRGKPSSATDGAGLDVRWPTYQPAAAAAGFDVGGYWRFFPSVDLTSQVQAFCGRLNAAPLALPPMVDIEDADGLGRDQLTTWARQALLSVQANYRAGVRPVLYTYRSFLDEQLDADRLLVDWPLALARWTDDERWPDDRAVFWQWAGDVTVPWSAGRVDLQRRRT